MEIWYRVNQSLWGDRFFHIHPVEVSNQTKCFVTTEGNKISKCRRYTNYFYSLDEAREFCLTQLNNMLASNKKKIKRLEDTNERIEEVIEKM